MATKGKRRKTVKVKNSAFDADDPEAMRALDFNSDDYVANDSTIRDLGLDDYTIIKRYQDSEAD